MTTNGRAVLFTQCLQADFVAPLGPHDPLPNALHVGRDEALRLLGPSPTHGAVAQIMAWARLQRSDDLTVIHVRDWHAGSGPEHHFEHFGPHCLAGEPGAAFVFDLPDDGSEPVVDSQGLSDFEGTNLAALLDGVRAAGGGAPLRAGVIGVWTEAKVTFLLYDLLTRGYAAELATCSALVASASRLQHFNALEQLRKLLGVRVFDSLGEFTEWLVPGGAVLAPEATVAEERRTYCPVVDVEGGDAPTGDDRDILGFLYRDSARLHLRPLSGGFSGARVYQVESRDALGHEQSPSVLKLGKRGLIGRERAAFERVEAVLGNSAPRIQGFADVGVRAGLKYAYAAMGRGAVRTFKSLYGGGAGQDRIDAVLDEVFGVILGRFTAAAQYERLPLFEYYTFAPRYGDGVRQRAAELLGAGAAADDEWVFPGGLRTGNPANFYGQLLPDLLQRDTEYHFVSYVHGDLNGANILVDSHDNVWLIDFFHAHRGHVVRDLAKFENDRQYVFTAVEDEGEFVQALAVTEALAAVADLRAPLQPVPSGVTAPALRRLWDTLATVRRHVAAVVRTERNPVHYRVALLRYAVHTLSFDESSPWQRRWALAAAATHAGAVADEVRSQQRLRVDWLAAELTGPGRGRLGITICPGRRDRGRDMEEDVAVLGGEGVELLVGCLTPPEMEWVGTAELPAAAGRHGIMYVHRPIRDQGVPPPAAMAELGRQIDEALDRGERVVVHCLGGLGRSGTVAACVLRSRGATADEALAAVREVRGPRAVESEAQETFVRGFTG